MAKNKDNFFKGMFLVASIYDLVLGAIFFLFYRAVFSYFNIPLPNYPMYLQMSAAFVIAMGFGYYFVYKNLYRNADLVKLGIVYKIAYSVLAIYFYLASLAHVIFFLLAMVDIIFLALFVSFLSYAKKKG